VSCGDLTFGLVRAGWGCSWGWQAVVAGAQPPSLRDAATRGPTYARRRDGVGC